MGRGVSDTEIRRAYHHVISVRRAGQQLGIVIDKPLRAGRGILRDHDARTEPFSGLPSVDLEISTSYEQHTALHMYGVLNIDVHSGAGYAPVSQSKSLHLKI